MTSLARTLARAAWVIAWMSIAIVALADSRERAAIDVLIPAPPSPVRADGYFHLAYEIHLTNFGPQDLRLWRIEITGDDPAAFPLGRYEGSELVDRLVRPGQPGILDKRRIEPGVRAVIYIWLSIDARSSLPTALSHRLTFTRSDSSKSVVEVVEEIPPIKIYPAPTVISAPLRGGQWLAANGPSNSSLHRRALLPIDGRAAVSQRFATDWIRLGDDGRTWRDDRSRLSNYHAFGAEVLAVADATVSAAFDGSPDNNPGSPLISVQSDTSPGNYVILNLGAGRFALYGHLQRGSIRVKAGEKIERGSVIGLVGNSGDSVEPQLHFQLADSNSPLRAEGLPYVLDLFEIQGRGKEWKPSQMAAEERRGEIPLQDTVVRFKESPRPTAAQANLAPEARLEDVASVDSIIAALYDTISGPAGKKRDWGRFRSLFSPAARLIPRSGRGGVESESYDVERYIASASSHLEKNGFFEKEIARKSEMFGRIAHAFSTYESRNRAEDVKPFARGINSIQLMNDGKRWWVVTVFWEAETQESPIPKTYLKR